jgi:hypothetical protein
VNTVTELDRDKLLRIAVRYVLGYYSLFNYPVTKEEILGSLPEKSDLTSLSIILDDLVEASEVYDHEFYYCLKEQVRELTAKRIKANSEARTKIPAAKRVGAFIYRFPFVRFVGISGSLSKGYSDKDSDFDFFIVTEKDRLWICRTILHFFKKLTFLVGRQHEFCMNYFIDADSLEIAEKNRFTAVELASLIPAGGGVYHEKLNKANQWAAAHFPNGYLRFDREMSLPENNHPVKKLLEACFNLVRPRKLNKKLMEITDKKWRKKWSKKNYPMSEYDLAFKTTLHVSKNHPANHQKRVMEAISKFEPGDKK